MKKSIRIKKQDQKPVRAFFLLLLLFLLPALSCSLPLSTDNSLQETQSALNIQQTFAAEAVATNSAQELLIAATSTYLAEQQQQFAENTVQAQQATISALETAAFIQQTAQAEKPTEAPQTAASPAPLPTNTSTGAALEEIALIDWKMSRFVKLNSGCHLTNQLCWKGNDDVLSDYIDLVLSTRESVKIDDSWPNPALLFWQKYDLPRPARVDINADGKWSNMANFSNTKNWHQYVIDLTSFKGKNIIVQFMANGRHAWYQTKVEWFIQDVKIVPNYTP